VGTLGLEHGNGAVRVAAVVVGLACVYRGVDGLAKRVLGRAFDTGAWACSVWLGLLVGGAVLADWLPLAEARDVSKTLTTPILLRPDLFSAHPLGTDNQGLDLLGEVLYGARVSLVVGVGGALLAMTIGGLLGITAGYFRGKVDRATSLFSDAFLALPPLILLLALVAFLGANVRNLTFALALVSVPAYIRFVRGNTLALSEREFVTAARALGAPRRRILFRELVPNLVLPLLSYTFIVVATLIVAEAGLSFLGLGVQRPDPTWGNMIAAGQASLETDPHLVFVPGVVLFITVLSISRVGEKVRRRWDSRVQQI
jgi:peptide/nickel transport system permease protein